MRVRPFFVSAWLFAGAVFATGVAFQAAPVPPDVDYERDIWPVLERKCLPCHNETYKSGGLSLASPEAFIKGGDGGAAVIPGESARSPLLQRILGVGGLSQMPLSGVPLVAKQVDAIRAWIDAGASLGTGKPTFPVPITSFTIGEDPKVWAVFRAHCIQCHSPEVASGGLDLTTAKSLAKGGVSGALVVPGDPAKSVLLRRMKGLDGKDAMPLGFGQLETAKMNLVEAWIKAGAKEGEARGHWAYSAPQLPAVPKHEGSTWIRNPIDAFVLARIKAEGLEASPEADRARLLRRLSLDIIGLPPSIAELDEFLADKRPDAYERTVERLLASPHFGERQARGWLDLARYADSDGFEKDLRRTAWPYRDWVIRAFNANMPYDEFTRQQMSGDLMPGATEATRVATGFHRNSMLNLEGGVDQAEAHFAVLVDRVNTTSTVWLGSTMACAKCHDHKYDPFSQRDYYSLLAFFSGTVVTPTGNANVSEEKWLEPKLELASPEQTQRREELKALLVNVEQEFAKLASDDDAFDAWRARASGRLEASPVRVRSGPTATWLAGDAGAWFDSGTISDQQTVVIDVPGPVSNLTGVVIEAVSAPTLPNGGPGRSVNGNAIVSRVEVVVGAEDWPIRAAATSFCQDGYSSSGVLDDNPETGWAFSPRYGHSHELGIEFDKPLSLAAGEAMTIRLACDSKLYVQHILGGVRVSPLTGTHPLERVVGPEARAHLASPILDSPTRERLRAVYVDVGRETRAAREAVAAARLALAQLEAGIPTALVLEERPDAGPLKGHVRTRGEFRSLAEEVSASTPTLFGSFPERLRANRAGLAEWLVSPQNPLVARVQVNRVWEQIFGLGLVATPDDFGTQGASPSHPELLDWLAVTYRESGWDTKSLIRLIVTSATYRQSASATLVARQRDPQNVFLARGIRSRLEAEIVRDVVLATAGLLDYSVGGPSVFPPQPAGVWNGMDGDAWTPSTGRDRYRRGIYTFWKRTSPYASFVVFDAPSREECTTRRVRTNTPLQALAQMNDPVVAEASQALAKRVLTAVAANDGERLALAFRMCTSRRPEPRELARITVLLSQRLEAGDPRETAFAVVANALLNLDETITKG